MNQSRHSSPILQMWIIIQNGSFHLSSLLTDLPLWSHSEWLSLRHQIKLWMPCTASDICEDFFVVKWFTWKMTYACVVAIHGCRIMLMSRCASDVNALRTSIKIPLCFGISCPFSPDISKFSCPNSMRGRPLEWFFIQLYYCLDLSFK